MGKIRGWLLFYSSFKQYNSYLHGIQSTMIYLHRIIIYPFDIRNLSRFADHCLSSQSIVFSYRTLDLFQNKQALLDITLSHLMYFHISRLKLLPVKHAL